MKRAGRSKDRAPRKRRPVPRARAQGLILVHTGNGKGKSTAAFGTALRALGYGWKVAVVQFIKGDWKTGEQEAAKTFGNRFLLESMGEGFTWDTKSFKRDCAAAKKAWKRCVQLLRDRTHQLVIFDEINYCLKYNFLKTSDVLRELRRKPALKHVILTGNGAPKALIQAADLVTEMRCLKHPFNKGLAAQQGIEY